MTNQREVSDKYNPTPEDGTESKKGKEEKFINEQKEIKRKDNTKHQLFYFFIFLFIIINYLSCSCEFQIFQIKFKGLSDWKGLLCLLIPQLIFILVWGARNNIDHLGGVLDRIIRIKHNIPESKEHSGNIN